MSETYTDTNVSASVSSGNTVKSRLAVIRAVTRERISMMSLSELRNYEYVETEVLDAVKAEFDLENAMRAKGNKWQIPQELSAPQIADIMLSAFRIVRVVTGGANSDYDLLAVYQDSGPDMGIYVTSEDRFRELASRYKYTLTTRELDEVLNILRMYAPHVEPCTDPDTIAVNNGLFRFDTKQLLPFTPDVVLLAKSRVDYNPNAANVVIHNDDDDTDWDVESWMQEFSDDDQIVNSLWEVLGAIVRPNVRWNRSAWFYSETGNNGKGTLCELMRQLCGSGTYCSIPLSEFGKDFMLEPLIRSSAIIVDENDVGTYIDKAANLKAVITGDTITINRKFKVPVPYKFHGFMVQCLNEFPRVKDKSDSFYRRQLFIPFEKCFTGRERKYIKEDYLGRQDVLEYVLKRVLHMHYYQLSTPQACEHALDEYKDFNDPVREFLKEMLPVARWDLLPAGFLYDLYCSWYRTVAGGDRNLKGRASFLKDVKSLIVSYYPDWEPIDDAKPMRPGKRMSTPEPLILEYDLDRWKSSHYRGNDPSKICVPDLATTYRGFLRRVPLCGALPPLLAQEEADADAEESTDA